VGKLEWLDYNLVKVDRTMIDSVVWAQYINVTDTDSHVAIANAAPTQCRRAAKNQRQISPYQRNFMPW